MSSKKEIYNNDGPFRVKITEPKQVVKTPKSKTKK